MTFVKTYFKSALNEIFQNDLKEQSVKYAELQVHMN